MIIGIVGLTLVNSRKIQSSSFEYGVLISYGASKRDFMLTNIIEVTLIISICTVIAYIVPVIFFTPIFPIMMDMELIMPLDKIIYWTIITFMTALVSSLLPFYKILKLQPTEVFRRAT